MTGTADILVVGAGPTGLALALQAHDHGARVRIVDSRPEAFRPSRAMILHARTLEVLRPLGVTDALLARADVAPKVDLHLGDRQVHVELAGLALPDTAFPHLTLVRQADVEEVLAQAVADRGIEVERGTELVAAARGRDLVRATLRTPARMEETRCAFLAGCDGTGSVVRAGAGIGWPGRPYAEEVVLADVELDGDLAHGVSHVAVGRSGLVFAFALGEQATWRILATAPARPSTQAESRVTAGELQMILDAADLDVRVENLVWSTRLRLQHRLASRFREGRVFLAGDAAHTHSPAGGQGMNGGIQDAANLGWKLAFAAAGTKDPALLDSYEAERRRAARWVITLTDLAFWGEASTGPLPSLLRSGIARFAAPVLPWLASRRQLVAEGVRVLSQLRLGYGASPLSREGTPPPDTGPRAGDRLPDATVIAGGRGMRIHELLAQPGVHVLLQRNAAALDHLALGRWVTVHRLTGDPGRGLVAVRPDGYIGFRCGIADAAQLRAWLACLGIAVSARRSPT